MGRSPNYREYVSYPLVEDLHPSLEEIFITGISSVKKFRFRMRDYTPKIWSLERECSSYGMREDFTPKESSIYNLIFTEEIELKKGESFVDKDITVKCLYFSMCDREHFTTWGLTTHGFIFNVESISIRGILTGLDILNEDGTVETFTFDIKDPDCQVEDKDF